MDPGLTFTSVSLLRHCTGVKIGFAGMQRDGDLVRLWLLQRLHVLVRQLLSSAGTVYV